MELGTLLFLLLLLACPLMMVFMMRGHGGHRHGAHGGDYGHTHGGVSKATGGSSLEELRASRAELDAEIAQLEDDEAETTTPCSA